ncbi:MAG: ABC transporter ATP-binding protein, partial [Chloroflexota bacterium]|nr:ABC transporter ATP-binding protein [Chloroflexota bacterium]
MSDNQLNKNEQPKQPSSQPPVRMGRGGRRGMVRGEKPRDFKGTIKRLVEYLGKYNLQILGVLLIAAASTVFSILGPKILGRVTTQLFEDVMAKITGTGGGVDFAAIGSILLQALTLYVLSSFLAFIQGYVMSGISTDISYRFRQDISQKINKLPLQYFDKVSQGEILSRVTNDVDTVTHTLNQSLSQIITSITSIIGILVMMLTISWQMTLVAVLTAPITILVINLIVNISQKYFVQQQNYLGHVNGHVEEMFGGHTVIKAFNAEEKSVKTFNSLNETLFTSAWKSQFLSQMIAPIMRLISNLGYVAVSILGGYYAIRGTITVGNIQ